MNRDDIIQQANERINLALSIEQTPDLSDLEAYDADLVAQIMDAYHAAIDPTQFEHELIWQLTPRFEQAFELMRITFDRDVLDPRAGYAQWFSHITEPPSDSAMIGRFWRASGRHTYSPDGALQHFDFDPLVATESVACVVTGNYFSLQEATGQAVGIGAIGYLATRSAMRRGRGHGTQLTAALETFLQARASELGETLRAIILESLPAAQPFWAKMGYRWPENSRYIQPPLNFDPQTGEATSDTADEYFMLKFMDGTPTEQISYDEMVNLVRVTYEHWYHPQLDTPQATERANQYIMGELLNTFAESIKTPDNVVRLVLPPAAR